MYVYHSRNKSSQLGENYEEKTTLNGVFNVKNRNVRHVRNSVRTSAMVGIKQDVTYVCMHFKFQRNLAGFGGVMKKKRP